jgi:hypothetical protein
MTVLGNVAATVANIGSLDPSSDPSPINSGIGIPSKSKVDRATRNKPEGSKVGSNRTSLRRKNYTIVWVIILWVVIFLVNLPNFCKRVKNSF